MKTVLVVYASRMGSTAEIASAVGDRFTRRGYDVDVHSTAAALDARLYDAVIVGSAVYLRRWDRDALGYLQAQAPDLAERPTWLFQSGPCGPGARTERSPTPARRRPVLRRHRHRPTRDLRRQPRQVQGQDLARRAGSRRGDLAGDSRDWNQIRAWADGVADQLESSSHADRGLIRKRPCSVPTPTSNPSTIGIHHDRNACSNPVLAETTTAGSPASPAARRWLAVARIGVGFIFLWAFLDKTFGLGYSTASAKAWIVGGSPTSGFLGHVSAGPLRTFFNALAGSGLVDALFMLGMLAVGVATDPRCRPPAQLP